MTAYTIKCSDCGAQKIYSARTLRALYDKARDEGWAINRDYTCKWCPNCAGLHRNVGRNGVRSSVQIKLDVN